MKAKSKRRVSEVYLHIGYAKTGTTALQRFFYENASLFADHGIYYPDNFRAPELGYHDWGHHILSHKWGGWLSPSVFPITPDEAWSRTAQEINSKPGKYILSTERFQDLLGKPESREILQFIKETIAPAKLKLVAYVRRQDVFAESHYKELVKNNFHKGTLAEYLANMPNFLKYDEFFDLCSEVVPTEDIIVRVYDRGYFLEGSIFKDFVHAIGEKFPDSVTYSEDITNASMNSAFVSLIGTSTLKALWKNKKFREQLFAFFDNRPHLIDRDKPLLDWSDKVEIMDRYKDSNERFAQKYLTPELRDAFGPPVDSGEGSFKEGRLVYSTADVRRLLEIVVNSTT